MSFKTETHLHVKETSSCGKLTAAEMVAAYAEHGFHTIFVSDHLKSAFYEKQGDLSWEEKTDRFLLGYEAARKAAEPYGMTVLLSAELQLNGLPNHYLLYGFEKSFLLREDLFDLTPEELHAYARENGVFVVQAHPFRDGKNIPTPPRKTSSEQDEVFQL